MNITAYVATASTRAMAERIADRLTRDGNSLQWIAYSVDDTCYVIGTARELRALERRGVVLLHGEAE